jgi:hypothetical protein
MAAKIKYRDEMLAQFRVGLVAVAVADVLFGDVAE